MKRIINNKKYRIKCPCCDCEFEYEGEDIERFPLYSEHSSSRVKCPECGTYLYHNDSVSSNLTTERLWAH